MTVDENKKKQKNSNHNRQRDVGLLPEGHGGKSEKRGSEKAETGGQEAQSQTQSNPVKPGQCLSRRAPREINAKIRAIKANQG